MIATRNFWTLLISSYRFCKSGSRMFCCYKMLNNFLNLQQRLVFLSRDEKHEIGRNEFYMLLKRNEFQIQSFYNNAVLRTVKEVVNLKT